jgi:hypothetical protein
MENVMVNVNWKPSGSILTEKVGGRGTIALQRGGEIRREASRPF